MLKLSDHFSYKKLLRFTLPGIMMMILSSTYGVIDGFFISNYVGSTAFAGVNFILPVIVILGFVGMMFGTGGSALIGKTMGEGDRRKANEIFSMLIYVTIAVGFIFGALGVVYLRKMVSALGAEGQLLEDSVLYGRIILLVLPFAMLQAEFHSLFPAAERPKIGMHITIAAGLTNIVLDALFIIVFSWGLRGAGWATAISMMVGGAVPIIYFARKNTSLLRLTKWKLDLKALLKTCSNGASEFVSIVAMSAVGILYNVQLLKYAGEDGVAAYGVVMYVSMIFMALFGGFAMGSAPIFSYHFGAKNIDELKGLFRRSFVIIGGFSVILFLTSIVFANPISKLFVGYDQELMKITQRGFRLYAFSFLIVGIPVFGSALFTALNDGFTSATIAFSRTLVFEIVAILIFPLILGLDGIWLSAVFAEAMALVVTLILIKMKRDKYQYY